MNVEFVFGMLKLNSQLKEIMSYIKDQGNLVNIKKEYEQVLVDIMALSGSQDIEYYLGEILEEFFSEVLLKDTLIKQYFDYSFHCQVYCYSNKQIIERIALDEKNDGCVAYDIESCFDLEFGSYHFVGARVEEQMLKIGVSGDSALSMMDVNLTVAKGLLELGLMK